MKTKYTILIVFITLLFSVNLHAQSDTLKRFPGQISFVYPIGTSGAESANYEFGFSINALVGVTGGIRGMECAGIMNTVKNNVLGIQCAGIMNTVNGNFTGYQGAGIMNVVNKDFIGVQEAGIINVTNKSFRGIQNAGIVNVVKNEFIGIQTTGVANIADKGFFGVQASSVANISKGESKYVQAAGIVNVNDGRFDGVQAAGIVNVVKGECNGVQAAGIVNIAHKLNGVQIGLINICDTLESGIPIGLINIVGEGGFHEWELSVADYANTRLTYKSGVKDFYTLYTIGVNYMEDKLFITGIGCGHIFELSPKFYIQPELMALSYNSDYTDRHDFSGSTHLKIGLTYNINKRFGISLAPSIYANVSDRDYPLDDVYKISPFKPFKTYTDDHVRVDIGAGLSFAILFR
ncbi:MAG: hypothetical protein WCR42_05815 [bacterium]